MSTEAKNWAADQYPGDPIRKLVLIGTCNFVNKRTGKTSAHPQTVAEWCNIHKTQTVSDAQRILAEKGFLVDFPGAVHNIQMALRLTDALPFTSRGPEQLHEPNFFSTAAKQLMSFLSSFRRFVSATPIATWDRHTAEVFLYSLKPVLEIHAELKRHVYGK